MAGKKKSKKPEKNQETTSSSDTYECRDGAAQQ